MSTSPGARTRVAFSTVAAIGLSLVAVIPAHASGGTPGTPTELFNAYEACSTDVNAPVYAASRAGLMLEGITTDTDTSAPYLTEQFQYWPVSDPANITTVSNNYAWPGNEASVSTAPLTDGQTYAWQARTVDQSGAASAWSAACYVADDDTFPNAAPTITSANYPQGQADQGGAPIQFTFGSNGVSDVAGFQYTWNDSFSVPGGNIGPHGVPQFSNPFDDLKGGVRATTLGGSATVSLVPPAGWGGYVTLQVRSMDRAFNPGPESTYSIWLKPTAPTVTKLSQSTKFGAPTSFRLTPDPSLQAASPVVSYTVQHMGSSGWSTTTVPASGTGTATVNLPLDGSYGDTLYVTSTSADGWVSDAQWWSNGYTDTTPTVASTVYPENGSGGGAGVPGTFTFTPKVKGAVVGSYTYSFDWDGGSTVAAGAHGDAQISWTPSASGWHMLTVYATTTDGVQLAPYYYTFTVN